MAKGQKLPVQKWVLGFLEDETNFNLGLEKGFKKFVKEKKEYAVVREAAYKHYYKKVESGEITPGSIEEEEKVEVHEDEIEITTFRTGVEKLPKDIFIPYKTGRAIDRLFSETETGGPMKGTVIVVTAPSGVGKSTVIYDLLAKLKKNYPKLEIGCLQGEMSKLDLEFEQLQKPWMSEVFFLLSSEQKQENMKAYLKKVFSHGFDILAMDSFQVFADLLVAWADMTPSQAEAELVTLILDTISARNKRGVFTLVLAIQQVTKGGIFKGSNKLKHAITGMLHLEKDKKGRRYAMFSKNRRNGSDTDKKMFFALNKTTKEMEYDMEGFMQTEKDSELLASEVAKSLQKETFTNIFGRSMDEVGRTITPDDDDDDNVDDDEDNN